MVDRADFTIPIATYLKVLRKLKIEMYGIYIYDLKEFDKDYILSYPIYALKKRL